MNKSEIINQMINHIIDNKNTEAGESFNSLISAKLNDALEAKKIEVAQTIYNYQEVDEPTDEEEVEEIEQEAEQT